MCQRRQVMTGEQEKQKTMENNVNGLEAGLASVLKNIFIQEMRMNNSIANDEIRKTLQNGQL